MESCGEILEHILADEFVVDTHGLKQSLLIPDDVVVLEVVVGSDPR